MQIHQLKPNTENRKKVQRGRGGKRGKTSGRGTKGQKARAGHKIRPEIRDAIRKLPKKRGYRFKSIHPKAVSVSLTNLEKGFAAGTVITPTLLAEKGIIKTRGSKISPVKIVSTGEVTKSFKISGCDLSAGAKEKIEKAGGSVI